MGFSDNQENRINDFIMKYNYDDEFKSFIQNLYENDISKLSIIQIYVLEEIIRYGNKGIFKEFFDKKGDYSLEQAVGLYDEFVSLLKEYPYFRERKIRQFTYFKDTLSEIELFVFELINRSQDRKLNECYSIDKKLEYDELNPILYDTDSHIKETLRNLLFGEVIYEILDASGMKAIKFRQKETGEIANIDKPLIIEKARSIISEEYTMVFNRIINKRYIKVKHALLLGKSVEVFNKYLKYNTNISALEITGKTTYYSREKIYKKFMKTFDNK